MGPCQILANHTAAALEHKVNAKLKGQCFGALTDVSYGRVCVRISFGTLDCHVVLTDSEEFDRWGASLPPETF